MVCPPNIKADSNMQPGWENNSVTSKVIDKASELSVTYMVVESSANRNVEKCPSLCFPISLLLFKKKNFMFTIWSAALSQTLHGFHFICGRSKYF